MSPIAWSKLRVSGSVAAALKAVGERMIPSTLVNPIEYNADAKDLETHKS
jgi:hypothetical protein